MCACDEISLPEAHMKRFQSQLPIRDITASPPLFPPTRPPTTTTLPLQSQPQRRRDVHRVVKVAEDEEAEDDQAGDVEHVVVEDRVGNALGRRHRPLASRKLHFHKEGKDIF